MSFFGLLGGTLSAAAAVIAHRGSCAKFPKLRQAAEKENAHAGRCVGFFLMDINGIVILIMLYCKRAKEQTVYTYYYSTFALICQHIYAYSLYSFQRVEVSPSCSRPG